MLEGTMTYKPDVGSKLVKVGGILIFQLQL